MNKLGNIKGYVYDSVRNRYFRTPRIEESQESHLDPVYVPNNGWLGTLLAREIDLDCNLSKSVIARFSSKFCHSLVCSQSTFGYHPTRIGWVVAKDHTWIYFIPNSEFARFVQIPDSIPSSFEILQSRRTAVFTGLHSSVFACASSSDQTSRLEFFHTTRSIAEVRLRGLVRDLIYLEELETSVVCHEDRITCLGMGSGQISTSRLIKCKSDPMTVAADSSDQIYYGSRNGLVWHFDLRNHQESLFFRSRAPVSSISALQNPVYLVSSTLADEMFLWDKRNLSEPVVRYDNRPVSRRYHPRNPRYSFIYNESMLFVSSGHCCAIGFDTLTGQAFGTFGMRMSPRSLNQIVCLDTCDTTFDLLCIYT